MFGMAFHFALFFSFLLASAVRAVGGTGGVAGAVLNSPNNGTFQINGLTMTVPTTFASPGSFNVFVAIDVDSLECMSSVAVGFIGVMDTLKNGTSIQSYRPYYQNGSDNALNLFGNVEVKPGQTIRMGIIAPFNDNPQSASILFINQNTLQYYDPIVYSEAGFCGRSAGWILDFADNSDTGLFPNFGSISFENAVAFGKAGTPDYGPQSQSDTIQVVPSNLTTSKGAIRVITTLNVDSLTFEYVD